MTRKRTMLLGSLLGDTAALGLHWIYNVGLIDKLAGDLHELMSPQVKQYHGTKKKGEHTHYGDQAIWLLESVVENGGFDREAFSAYWQRKMMGYDGYLDHASKDTIAHPRTGSNSDDFAGASRMAPVLYAYSDNPEKAVEAARAQTSVTHNNDKTIATAEALAVITLEVLEGAAPQEAIDGYAESLAADHPLTAMLTKARASRGKDTRETIKEIGQMCGLEAALPSALHVVLSYPDDFYRAQTANILAGGDQAARGMAIGMILGAAGLELPEAWLEGYVYREKVESLLDALD